MANEGRFRRRRAESIVAELQQIGSTSTVQRLDIVDFPIDLADPEQLPWWSAMWRQVESDWRWSIPVWRLDDDPDRIAHALRDAGVCHVRLASVWGSARSLRQMRVPADHRETESALGALHRVGIETELTIRVGPPSQNPGDRMRLLAWLGRVSSFTDNLILMPFEIEPGSAIDRRPDSFRIWWPPGRGQQHWIHDCWNNRSYRWKDLAEIAVYARSMGIEVSTPASPANPDGRQDRDRVAIRPCGTVPDTSHSPIVLATTPPWGTDNPPVGLGYLSESLTVSNRHVNVVDGNAELFRDVEPIFKQLWHHENKNFWSHPETFRDVERCLAPWLDRLADKIVGCSPFLVGLSVVDPKERSTAAVIERVRQRRPETPIVLGGPACLEPASRRALAKLIEPPVLAMVAGEGEGPLLEIASRLETGLDLEGIPGTVPGSDPMRSIEPWRADLEAIPWPRYAAFDVGLYGSESAIVQWSRGCIGRCSFCKGHEVEGVYRHRNPSHVADELSWQSAHGVRRFTVCDNELNGNLRFLRQVCEVIIERGLDLEWKGQAIPHRGMTTEILDLMRRAGCTEIQYGLESGSNHVLGLMRKGRLFSAETAESVLKATRAAGVRASIFLIIGFPGEGEGDFRSTLELIERNAKVLDSIKSVNALHVIEDTALQRQPEAFGISLGMPSWHRDWTSLDDVNTPQVRHERVLRTLALARQLGIPVLEHNLEDDKADRASAELSQTGTTPRRIEELIEVHAGDERAADRRVPS